MNYILPRLRFVGALAPIHTSERGGAGGSGKTHGAKIGGRGVGVVVVVGVVAAVAGR